MLNSKPKKIIFGLLLAFIVLVLSVLGLIMVAYNKAELNINQLTSANTGIKLYSSSYMEEDESFSYNMDRKIVNIDDLNEYTVNAFIAIEDKRFYSHSGYDIKRMVKSMLVNLKEQNKSQGASTITQQLVKNTMLSNEKTYERKLKEIMLAIKVEKEFSKDEIMNMYLNTIYFGSNAYGIENASQIYFNKSAKDLTLNESAILASIIKSPRTYSPKLNPDKCFSRKNLVLKEMLKNDLITQAEYDENVKMEVICSETPNSYDNSYYQQAIIEACNLLDLSEKELIRNNYQIITFMDKNIQNSLTETYQNSNLDCDKLSIVANSDGEILAYLGDSDYDLSSMKRSPASLIKPLAVYLPSIVHNITYQCSPILDEETTFNDYNPHNTGDKYYGWVSTKTALSQSLNIPAVKLLNCLGVEKATDFLEKLNININEQDKNLSLALGGMTEGLSPIQILQAYSIFQNYGKMTNLRFVDKILDENGNIIYKNEKKIINICDEESAYLLTDMLTETAKSGSASKLADLNIPLASKTGTNYVSGKTLDLYNLAFTPKISILSWLGDATNEGLENLSSSFHATALNKDILEKILQNQEILDFKRPENIIEKEIDSLEYELNHRVILASENTPERYKKTELFKTSHLPIMDNSLYNSPDLNYELNLTNQGVEFKIALKEIFDYQIIKTSNKKTEILAETSNTSEEWKVIDEKVFCYDNIKYKIIATNKYTNEKFVSEEKEIYPKEYLIAQLKNNERIYEIKNKSRWYV